MFLALLVSLATAQTIPPGVDIDPAVGVQVSQDGLDAVSTLVPGLIPTDDFAVGDQSGGTTCFAYDISNMWAGVEVDDVEILPGTNNELLLDVDLTAWINDPNDMFTLDFEAFCAGDTCPGYIDPFPMNVVAPIELSIGTHPDGEPMLVATVGEMTVNSGLSQTHTQLDCTTGTIEDLTYVLNFLGIDIYQLIVDQAVGPIRDEIQTQLDEALLEARFADTINLMGTPLELGIYPSSVAVTNDGLALGLMGSAYADQADCVSTYDPGGSLKTDNPIPAASANPPGTQLAAHASDDFLNQLLYAVWRAGTLCQTIDDSADLPLAIDTSLLTLLGGESFEPLVPEQPQPLQLVLDPKTPPTVDYTGSHDVDIHAEELHMNFYTELDGRQAKVLDMNLTVDAGADLEFDGTTGELAVALDIGEDAFTAVVDEDVFVKGAEADIEANFSDVLAGLLPTLLGSFLGDNLAFGLPNMDGMGVTDMNVAASGPANDWLGIYTEIGPVTYGDPDAGCGCDGQGSGCEGGGCAVTSRGAPLGVLALLLAFLRRRR